MGYNPQKRLIETRLPEHDFAENLRFALAGGKKLQKVIWSSAENEVVVHLDKTKVVVQKGRIIVGLSVECDQFGLQELVLPFSVGDSFENSFLLAVTPREIGGHQGLARTWGEVAARAVWQGCLDALQEKWRREDGLDHFKVKGLVSRAGEVHGVFAYPSRDGIRKPEESGGGVKELVDSLELAQIHLGRWTNGPLKPVAVHKVKGRVHSIKFSNGAVMKGDEVAALVKQKKITVDKVVAVRRGGKLFLRGIPDKRATDLLDLPRI